MPEQVFFIPYDEREPEIPMGFNSQAGVFPGTALRTDNIDTVATNPGQVGSAQAEIITTHEELMDKLDLGVSVSARYGLASGSVKTNFSQQTNYNSTCTVVLAHFFSDNVIKRGHDPVLPDGSAAKELIDANRMDDFRAAFGDYFVRGIKTGGQYIAVIRITSVSTSIQESLSISCAAEVNGLVAAGSFNSSLGQAHTDTSGETDVSISFYQAGGLGKAEAGATLNVDEVMQRLRDFPGAVADHPIGVTVELASYGTVPVSVAPLEEIQNLEMALSDAHDKRLEYLTARNDADFAIQHPEYFTGLPAKDELTQIFEAYTKAVNAVMAHMVKLARGEMNPAQLFDPSGLNLPAPPTYTRKPFTPPPPKEITLPDFTKIETDGTGTGGKFGKFGTQFTLFPLKQSEDKVTALGLKAEIKNVSGADPNSPGVAAKGQDPPPGSVVPAGSTVTLTF
jgi:hypothetical protein